MLNRTQIDDIIRYIENNLYIDNDDSYANGFNDGLDECISVIEQCDLDNDIDVFDTCRAIEDAYLDEYEFCDNDYENGFEDGKLVVIEKLQRVDKGEE